MEARLHTIRHFFVHLIKYLFVKSDVGQSLSCNAIVCSDCLYPKMILCRLGVTNNDCINFEFALLNVLAMINAQIFRVLRNLSPVHRTKQCEHTTESKYIFHCIHRL
jgi:hypothetical protein